MHQQERIPEGGYRELSVSSMRAQGIKSCDLFSIAITYAKETTESSSGNVNGPLLGDLKRRYQIALKSASALGLAKELLNLDSIKPFISVT